MAGHALGCVHGRRSRQGVMGRGFAARGVMPATGYVTLELVPPFTVDGPARFFRQAASSGNGGFDDLRYALTTSARIVSAGIPLIDSVTFNANGPLSAAIFRPRSLPPRAPVRNRREC